MELESKHVEIKCSVNEVYEYLCDLNNFEELLPPDKYSNWQSNTDYCSFKVQAATIDLRKDELTENQLIKLVSGDKAPFPYVLNIHMKETPDGCEGHIVFTAEINQFLQMMVQGPLSNLFNYIANRLKEVKSKA